MLTPQFPSPTPIGNTGLKSQTASTLSLLQIKIDWSDFSYKGSFHEFQRIAAHVELFLSDKFTWSSRPYNRGQSYDCHARSVRGVLICWKWDKGTDLENLYREEFLDSNDKAEDRNGIGCISIPAKALSILPSSYDVFTFLCVFRLQFNCRCNRFDIAIDDYDKSIDVDDVRSACVAGNYARIRTVPKLVDGFGDGFTFYFGSRQSSKFVRFYDKFAESKGLYDCHRWELVCREDFADAVFTLYCNLPQDEDSFNGMFPQVMTGLLPKAIDFIDKHDKNLDRCERLPWWQKFCDRLGAAIVVKLQKPKPTMDRKFAWMKNQVQTSLAMIADNLGNSGFVQWISNQLVDGRKRYTESHLAMLNISIEDMKIPTLRETLNAMLAPMLMESLKPQKLKHEDDYGDDHSYRGAYCDKSWNTPIPGWS